MVLSLEGFCMKYRLHPKFADTIAQHGFGMNEFADLAGIARTTLYALQSPDTHPHRVGGMHRVTAWKLINTFAERTGFTPQVAKEMLVLEDDSPQPRRGKKTKRENSTHTDQKGT